jgi:hypothetical protein
LKVEVEPEVSGGVTFRDQRGAFLSAESGEQRVVVYPRAG